MTKINEYPLDTVLVEGLIQAGTIPVWIEDDSGCYRGTMQLPVGIIDCTFVRNCIQPTIDGINSDITSINGDITTINSALTLLGNRTTVLEGDSHTHTNKAVLDGIDNTHGAEAYLGGDGLYHPTINGYYQITSNGNPVDRRHILEFDTTFSVTDDPAGNRTIVSCLGGSGSGAPGADNSVTSGTFNVAGPTLTLNKPSGSINIDMTGIMTTANDDYVTSGNYNNGTQVLRLTRRGGTNIDIDMSSLAMSEHSQAVAASGTANINHGLGRHPVFTSVDSAGMLVIPESVHYVDGNNVTITYNPAFTGTVYRM